MKCTLGDDARDAQLYFSSQPLMCGVDWGARDCNAVCLPTRRKVRRVNLSRAYKLLIEWRMRQWSKKEIVQQS